MVGRGLGSSKSVHSPDKPAQPLWPAAAWLRGRERARDRVSGSGAEPPKCPLPSRRWRRGLGLSALPGVTDLGLWQALPGHIGPLSVGICSVPNPQPISGLKLPPCGGAAFPRRLTSSPNSWSAGSSETERGLPFPPRTRQRRRLGSVVMSQRGSPSTTLQPAAPAADGEIADPRAPWPFPQVQGESKENLSADVLREGGLLCLQGVFVGTLDRTSRLWHLTSLPVPVIFKVPQVSIAASLSALPRSQLAFPNRQCLRVSPERSLLSVCAWEARLEPRGFFSLRFY